MKKLIAFFLMLAVLIGAGCAGAEYQFDELYKELPFANVFPMEDGEVLIDGEAKQITIGFVQTALNHPWRIAMNESLQAQTERFPNVELIILDGEADAAKQANCIEDLIAREVDAIILSPMDSVSFDNSCANINAEGIPLIVLDRDVNNSYKTCYIGQSNYSIGYALGLQLAKDFNGKANVVELTGNVGNAVTIDRSQGFYDAIADYP